MRIIADIPEKDVKAMDEIAAARGISRAELMRQYAAEGLAAEKSEKKDWSQFFGKFNVGPLEWNGVVYEDSVDYVRAIRDDWSHDDYVDESS